MVKMVENWTRVEGVIRDLQPSDEHEGFDDLRIDVSKVENWQAYPNLLEGAEGKELHIKLPHERVQSLALASGDNIEGVLRAAPNQQFFFSENSVGKIH